MIPSGVTFRTRWLNQSAMKRLPARSTAAAEGKLKLALLAGPPSPLKAPVEGVPTPFPAMVVMGWLGAEYFWKSFGQNERIVTSPWLPIVWPFKFVMPLTAALLIVQGLSELIKSVQVIVRRSPA
jgi:hypothetical protein